MNDDNEGRGGSYRIDESGARVLLERTRNPGDAPPDPAPPVLTEAIHEPADAGFFTPVAPADPTQETE